MPFSGLRRAFVGRLYHLSNPLVFMCVLGYLRNIDNMKKGLFLFRLGALAVIALSVQAAVAQDGGKKKKKSSKDATAAPAPPQKPKDEKPTIASKIKSCVAMPGMFPIYQDTTNGKVYMLIKKDQLGVKFIHFTYTENGVLDAGLHRGQFRGSRIFRINKYYDNLEFEQVNTSFYFDSANNISKSAEANISPAILAYEKIVAQDAAKGEYLIDADELLLSEKLHMIKPPSIPGAMRFNLGMLSKSKTRFEGLHNYPENSDFVVRYVFENPSPMVGGGEAVTDARAVTVLLQHSFIKVPDNNFKPRFDDARVGYFSEEVNNMTSLEAVNYRDMIHRWNLQKKDPAAAVSEPVKPIVWWIEKTTPKEFRATIKEAALTWNRAFEPLGFRNAVQVFEQPDSATWDAGDIRYNVLRWTSSPQPPFGGYGPSFVNPETGEILGADIMLEYIFVTNRLIAEKLFEVPKSMEQYGYCSAGHHLHMETLLGKEMLMAAEASEVEISELVRQSLFYLVLHEMGHTMGLMHNMKASQLHTPAELKNAALTNESGLIGSVMDYPAINLNFKKGERVQYCQTKPGPYDLWAIEYGYSTAVSDPAAETARLKRILDRSTEPGLTFGNDADDMRSPGKAMDPRVMINDLSSDAIAYSTERMDKIMSLLPGLKDRYAAPGQTYQELKNVFNNLAGGYGQNVGIISRYIGGVMVERAVAGQPGATQPYTPVKKEDQKRAMQALAKYAFAPDAFTIPTDLLPYLQTQRRGYNFFATTEDPKIHYRLAYIQAEALDHLLDNSVMQRLTDSRLYGNQYSLSEMLSDLTAAIFDADMNGNVNSFRQQLQIDYVKRLIAIVDKDSRTGHDDLSIAKVSSVLKDLQKKLKASAGGDKESRDHRAYLADLIEKAFKD